MRGGLLLHRLAEAIRILIPCVSSALEGAHAGVVRSRAHNLSGKAEPSPTIALYKQSFDDAYRALTTLLKHLRQDVTGLSVAFSGNAITVDAAIAQAAKVDTNLDRLVACIVAVPKETCLRQEWRKGVENVAEQVQHLLETLIADAEAPATNTSTSVASSSTAKPPPKPYLIATSATWEAIDQLLQNASSSEKSAIKSVWKQDQAYMTDAYTEFKELLEEDEGIGGEEENDEEDDEWAALERELGGSTETMTEEERARITGVSNSPIFTSPSAIQDSPDHSCHFMLSVGCHDPTDHGNTRTFHSVYTRH